MPVENPVFEQNRARNRLFPGWWTSSAVNPRHLQPLYIIRCRSEQEFFEAHAVKPGNVRAEIISPDYPRLNSSSDQELNTTLVASDLMRNLGLGMFLGGIAVAASVTDNDLIQGSDILQIASGVGLSALGVETVRRSTRLARHAIAEARARGLNVAKGLIYRQLSRRPSDI